MIDKIVVAACVIGPIIALIFIIGHAKPQAASVDAECVRKASIALSKTRDDYLNMAKTVCLAGEDVTRATGGWRPW